MKTDDPYGRARIARGVLHLLGGKALVSFAGLGTFVLLVRALPVDQFAAYTVLFALVELVDALSGFGASQVLSRYVPELYVAHRRHSIRKLVIAALAIRCLVLALFLAAIYALAPVVAPVVGLGGWEWALRLYLAVVLVRVLSASLFGVLESMLHQKIAQFGAGSVTLLRFALFWLFAAQGALDLRTVILLELATDLLGVVLLAVGTMRAVSVEGQPDIGDDRGWVRANLRRMIDFGIKGYLQHLLILPFGSSVQRLLVGAALPAAGVALFGFALSVADLFRRYLPVKLLAGVIRPVLTARYVRDRRFPDLVRAGNLIFKINAIGICLAIVTVFAGGTGLLDLVTSGKYDEGGVGLLMLMFAALVLFSLRHTLDHVSHAVERNGPLIVSNAVITLSIVPGVAMLPALGVYALPVSNLLGLGVGCAVLVWRLRVAGLEYRLDGVGLGKVLGSVAIGLAAAAASFGIHPHWAVSVAAGLAACAGALALLQVFDADERNLLRAMLKRG